MTSRYITIIFCLQLFLVLIPSVQCQEREKELIIEYSATTPNKAWIEKINNTQYQDSLKLLNSLNSLRGKYYSNGYLSAGFEILYSDSSELKVKFSSGIKYEWGSLRHPLDHPPEITKLTKIKKVKSGQIITVNQIDDIRRSFLKVYENNGYPFASVRYDSITIEDGVINTNLVVEPGPFVFFDSIVNRSEDIVSRKVLKQILNLKIGEPYSEKKLLQAGNNIGNSRIIQLVNPLEVGFNDDKAWVYVGARKKVANSFDGIIGLVPGNNSQGFSFTGSLDLSLSNLLKQAESFSIRWKAPGNQNQRLNSSLDIPYFLGLPVGISSSIELFRKDSSFLNTMWSVGLQAAIQNNNRLGFYYRVKSSNILLNNPIENLSDVNSKLYGVDWNYEKLENPVNPFKGLLIQTNLGVGNKIIAGRDLEKGEDFYWEGNAVAKIFLPITKFWVIHFGGRAGYNSSDYLYDNEKFRIGGLTTLRGFDEELILADSYFIGTAEIRYLFSMNSNFHIFADGGKWWSNSDSSRKTGLPIGFGIGLSLETRAGIILLDYALGTSQDYPLSMRNGKIHLGIKSLF